MAPQDVLQFSAGIASIAVVLSASEVLASLRDYGGGGGFDLAVNRPSPRFDRWSVRVLQRAPALTQRLVGWLASLRLVTVGPILIPGASGALLAAAAAVSIVIGWTLARFAAGRQEFGEQMVKTILGGAALGWLGGSDITVVWAIWFVAGQGCLAYSAAGIFKALSPRWRSGEALWQILVNEQLGHPPLGVWLRPRPRLSVVLSWCTIIWETAFPLVLIAPPWLLVTCLVAGVCFHLALAFTMGLNTYLWAFVATYPAIVFVNYSLRAWLF